MKNFRKFITTIVVALIATLTACNEPEPIKALVISGQNNHNWRVSHLAIKQILDNSGLFTTDILLTPPTGGDMSTFNPKFSDYDVVVLDYNGDRWSEKSDSA